MTVGIVVRLMPDLLNRQLPTEEPRIHYTKFVGDTLCQKLVQSSIDGPLLLRRVAIPVDDLVRKPLATATHRVTNAGGANANTGSSDGGEVRHKASVPWNSSSFRHSAWRTL